MKKERRACLFNHECSGRREERIVVKRGLTCPSPIHPRWQIIASVVPRCQRDSGGDCGRGLQTRPTHRNTPGIGTGSNHYRVSPYRRKPSRPTPDATYPPDPRETGPPPRPPRLQQAMPTRGSSPPFDSHLDVRTQSSVRGHPVPPRHSTQGHRAATSATASAPPLGPQGPPLGVPRLNGSSASHSRGAGRRGKRRLPA